jgi:hypothetical protein
MAKGKLFECAVLYHPLPKTDDKGNVVEQKSEMVSAGVKTVLASSEQQAGMIMARAIPEEFVEKLDQIEVLIRPF